MLRRLHRDVVEEELVSPEVLMDWMKQLGGVLDRYADRGAVPPPDSEVHEDFDQFVQAFEAGC